MIIIIKVKIVIMASEWKIIAVEINEGKSVTI